MTTSARTLTPFVLLAALAAGCSKQPEAAETRPSAAQTGAQAHSNTAAAAPAKVAAQPSSGGLLAVGADAPKIKAKAHNGQDVDFEQLKGKVLVVYFYPRDDTPGCTIEARGFTSAHADLEKEKAVVIGVSTDDNGSHQKFAEKYGLPFLLLPDPDESIAKQFGVNVSSGFAQRVTFIIDRQGKVARVYPSVNPTGHAEEVLAEIRKLES